MERSTEQAVKDALRKHHGGLGPSLSEEERNEILNGRPNKAENDTPVDGDKFYDAVVSSLNRHPIEWILK